MAQVLECVCVIRLGDCMWLFVRLLAPGSARARGGPAARVGGEGRDSQTAGEGTQQTAGRETREGQTSEHHAALRPNLQSREEWVVFCLALYVCVLCWGGVLYGGEFG